MGSRLGFFALGFAAGALTVAGFRRLRDVVDGEGYGQLADEVQDHLLELESRISGEEAKKIGAPRRKARKAAGRKAAS